MDGQPWTRWLRDRDLRVIGGVSGCVLMVWAFLEIAEEVREPEPLAFDDRILLALRDPAHLDRGLGPPWLEDMVRDVSAVGSMTLITAVTLSVVGYLLLARQRRTALVVIVAVTGGALLGSCLKGFFGRARPSVVPHLTQVTSLSFPSGHSMLSAILYPTLGVLLARVMVRKRIKAYLVSLSILVALLVGASRVYLGVHYPTDVLAGWAVGFAWALACGLAARALQRRGKIDVPARSPA